MNTWINQPGYPIISARRDYYHNTCRLVQTSFTPSASNNRSGSLDEKWWIPVNYATEDLPNFENTETTDLLGPDDFLSLGGIKSEKWLIINKQQTGLLRSQSLSVVI